MEVQKELEQIPGHEVANHRVDHWWWLVVAVAGLVLLAQRIVSPLNEKMVSVQPTPLKSFLYLRSLCLLRLWVL